MTKNRVVGVIGLGHVGAHVAYSLAVQGIADELVLVDQIGNENKVMKRTLPAFAVILVLYMALTMLYTCVLFPSFGV